MTLPHDDPFTVFVLPDRGVLRLGGPDRVAFLQGLVSNDVAGLAPDVARYACLLTPQGKFLHDFFLIADGETILIECEAGRREDLLRRLKMFRLRSKVELADETDSFTAFVLLGRTDPPDGAIVYDDPRRPALGTRVLAARGSGEALAGADYSIYDRLRIAEAVPDGGRDMEIGKAILLENNIDLLNGIAWDKGCYMGQELTARTRYRGLVKKRLIPVRIDGAAPGIGAPLIRGGVEIGEMRTRSGDLGLALLRLGVAREAAPIALDGVTLTPLPPEYLTSALAERESA